ncbi:MAG: cytochrome c1 [Rhodospirillales bacterium]|nr:cytochrome c1 [Rhodospirillales bacterium]
MKKTFLSVLSALAIVGAVSFTSTSVEASGGVAIPQQKWSWTGPFGTFDRAALRRGLQVYTEVCSGCHSLNLMSYRNLADIGFSEDEIKAIAADYEVEDGPDDEGEMFFREAMPADKFVSPFANEKAARASNNGAMPPDLSLMIKARKDGANYVHALLNGYEEEAPEGVELNEGMSYNHYFPGNQIAMAPPVEDDYVEYEDGTPATQQQITSDIVTFLAWAAEPELEERKKLGLKVMIFLGLITFMLYGLKRKIWAKLH